eukprot:2459245-Rhodomonas_salina.1
MVTGGPARDRHGGSRGRGIIIIIMPRPAHQAAVRLRLLAGTQAQAGELESTGTEQDRTGSRSR